MTQKRQNSSKTPNKKIDIRESPKSIQKLSILTKKKVLFDDGEVVDEENSGGDDVEEDEFENEKAKLIKTDEDLEK